MARSNNVQRVGYCSLTKPYIKQAGPNGYLETILSSYSIMTNLIYPNIKIGNVVFSFWLCGFNILEKKSYMIATMYAKKTMNMGH